MKLMRKILAILIVVCMALGTIPAAYAADGSSILTDGQNGTNSSLSAWQKALRDTLNINSAQDMVSVEKTNRVNEALKQLHKVLNYQFREVDEPAADEIVRVMVILEGESLLERDYTTEQIATASETASAVNAIEREQSDMLSRLRDVTGIADLSVRYSYNVVVSGFSVDIPYGKLEAVRALDGVKSAFVAPTYSVPASTNDTSLETNMGTATGLAGATRAWDTLNYRGQGMRVAIIDTGLDVDHPSFADAPELTDDSLSEKEIEDLLESLNAYKMYGGKLSVDDLYYSEKVPFGFNYADSSTDVSHDNDYQGDHGTHVAGIAAANDIDSTDVVGMAPEAQILAMKVFGNNAEGATFDIIVAALEDCYRLNADVVNLSLGSPAGFSSEYEEVDAVFAQVLKSDMILAVSSGNEASFSYGNAMGTDKNYTYDPDVGLMGSPGAYIGATTVASMENDHIRVNYLQIGERKIGYKDSGDYYAVLDLAGKEYEYVMVPGYGAEEDYYDVDVYGKIAVVSRGELDFYQKQVNAFYAGAVMCIVYDNTDGALIYMQDAALLPSAFISKEDGEALAAAADAAADAGEVAKIRIGPEDKLIPVDSGVSGTMSTFSSVGVTPDLKLEPDITSYGGNIYSTLNGGTYGTMSGTSMSTPAVAGMSALVLQYLRDQYNDLTDEQKHTVAEALLMSTATALVDPTTADALYYSTRLQGAGNANVYNALTSPAYLTVGGSSPKVSLGDDDSRSGLYSFTFEINNLTNSALVYSLGGMVQTDQYVVIDGVEYMGETARKLDAEMRFSVIDSSVVDTYDINGDGILTMADVMQMLAILSGAIDAPEDFEKIDVNGDGVVNTADVQAIFTRLMNTSATTQTVTVPAGESVTVSVTVELTQEDKQYLEEHYENGMYVEGFVTLNDVNGEAVELSLPYLGFYGDWSAARVFDSGYWYESEEELEYMRYPHVLFTKYGEGDSDGGYGFNLGLNPYLDEAYDPSHNVLSPNGDGYNDYIGDIYLGMMRNARRLDFIWSIYDENGDLIETETATADYVRKSYYYSYYGLCVPFTYNSYFENLSELGAGLADGSRIELTIEAYLDDGDDIMDERLSFPIGDGSTTTLPIYIDSTAPTVVDEKIEYRYDENKDERYLDFYVQDNYAIAAVVTTTLAGDIIDVIEVPDSTEPQFISLDVSDYDTEFYLCVCDYGANETEYKISFHGKDDVDFDSFYGYRYASTVDTGYDYTYETDSYNGWYSFKSADDMLRHTNESALGEAKVTAAEYIDGYILGIDDEGGIFAIKAGTWTRTKLGTLKIDNTVCTAMDMTFDPVNKVIYLIAFDGDYSYNLVRMDYLTGEYEVLGTVYDSDSENGLYSHSITLACDNNGVLYSIDAWDGNLFTIDPETLEATYVASTYYYPQGERQSMTFDRETNELYWAANDGEYGGVGNYLYRVDTTTGELDEICEIEAKGVMTGLYKPYKSDVELYPEDEQVTGLQLSRDSVLLGEGRNAEIICKQLPFYATELVEVEWESSNPDVVTVENGVLTAVGEGKATVTVRSGDMSDSCEVEVFRFEDELYAFDTDATYQWVKFPSGKASEAEYPDDNTYYNVFSAAAYHDGYVYACDYNGNMYRLDPETLQGVKLCNIGDRLMGMAFDYADGFMYGIQMYFDDYGWQTATLVRVNLLNGEVKEVAWPSYYEFGAILCGPAIDLDGNFYFITVEDGTYRTRLLQCSLEVDEYEYGFLTIEQTVDLSDYPTQSFGAMHYSTTNGGLYWTNDAGELLWTHPSTFPQVQVVELGNIGKEGSTQMMALFSVPENEPEAPTADLEDAYVLNNYLIPVGAKVNVDLTFEPWNAAFEAKYEIANTGIATVDEDGFITGVSVGETELTFTIEGTEFSQTVPVRVIASVDKLGGYLIDDGSGNQDQWIRISDTLPDNATVIAYGDYDMSLLAGTYYNGMIYGVAADSYGQRYFVHVEDIENECEMTALAKVNVNIRDMAFDYTTGTLYGIAEGGKYTGAIVQFDIRTGKMSAVAETGKKIAAMTIDHKGTMYAIEEYGSLYTVDKQTGETDYVTSFSNYGDSAQQSMTWSAETGMIYWSQADDFGTSALYVIDPSTGESAKIGNAAQIAALYCPTETEPTVPETVEPTGVLLQKSLFMITGSETTIDAVVLPVSVATVDGSLTWESSDDKVVKVDENGKLTAVAAGKATVTVTNAAGQSTECAVTVSDTERTFFAYDYTHRQWISFLAGNTSEITVVRYDEEGELTIKAAAFTGTTIYAYDEYGYFYTINPETFERTYVGAGVSEQILAQDNVDIRDLAWDATSGKLYAAAVLYDAEAGYEDAYCLVEVNLETGEVSMLLDLGYYYFPANLTVYEGNIYFIDSYNCTLMSIDMDADDLVAQYVAGIGMQMWNERDASIGFVVDPVTEIAYVVYDATETWYNWDGESGQAILYTIDLETGLMEATTEATTEDGSYISDGILIFGLFVN